MYVSYLNSWFYLRLNTTLGVVRFGYGRHESELPLDIRHAGTPLKVCVFYVLGFLLQ